MQEDTQKPYNLEPNVESAFAYLPFVGFLTSIAILIMEKDNKTVRFHAIQGLLFGIFYMLLVAVLGTTLILIPLVPLVNLAAFGIWLFMMWKAYNNKAYELPFIGNIARDQVK